MANLAHDLAGGDGGGIGSQIWLPDASPASPHAKNDEFNAATLDLKWNKWDVPVALTTSVGESCAKLLSTSQATDALVGIYQAIPGDDEWAIYGKLGVRTGYTNFFGAFLFIAEDVSAAPATANATTIGIVGSALATANGIVQVTNWSQYNTVAAVVVQPAQFPRPDSLYARIRVAMGAATIGLDFSTDGIGWIVMHEGALTFTPSTFGLAVNNFNTGGLRDGVFDFFRVFTGAGTSTARGSALLGRLLSL